MANLNKVMLIGNLGKDSELRYSQNGSPFATFSLAVNKAYKNANGDKVEKTTWINIVLFGKTAESLHQYLMKGKQVYIEGELNIKRYTDKDGLKDTEQELSEEIFSLSEVKKRAMRIYKSKVITQNRNKTFRLTKNLRKMIYRSN